MRGKVLGCGISKPPPVGHWRGGSTWQAVQEILPFRPIISVLRNGAPKRPHRSRSFLFGMECLSSLEGTRTAELAQDGGGDKVGTQKQTRKHTRQDAEPEWNGWERQSHRRVLLGPG